VRRRGARRWGSSRHPSAPPRHESATEPLAGTLRAPGTQTQRVVRDFRRTIAPRGAHRDAGRLAGPEGDPPPLRSGLRSPATATDWSRGRKPRCQRRSGATHAASAARELVPVVAVLDLMMAVTKDPTALRPVRSCHATVRTALRHTARESSQPLPQSRHRGS
jgi:hypothetical protein